MEYRSECHDCAIVNERCVLCGTRCDIKSEIESEMAAEIESEPNRAEMIKELVSIKEWTRMLNDHDWYFQYSDVQDYGVTWNKSYTEHQRIHRMLELARILSYPEYQVLYSEMRR